jgi:uncharacterized protein (TIGR00730 family)
VATEAPTHVLVFCASSESCGAEYHDGAARLGRVLARGGQTIVYGGGALGSMGALAGAALAAGGQVQGIQPKFMNELGWTHEGLHALDLVEDMQERMRRMLAIADAIVALPGGTGTLEELLDALTAKRLGEIVVPIIIVNQLVNQQRFFDPLIEQLSRCVDERFMDERHRDMWQVVATPEEVPGAIAAAPAWARDALSFASV